jgi:DNA polymerase-1
MTTLIADIEADGLLNTITTIHQISVIDMDNEDVVESYHNHATIEQYNSGAVGTIKAGLKRLAEADTIIGHNFIGYDGPAVRIVSGVELDWRKMIDTLVLSRLGNPSRPGGHSLEAWAGRLGEGFEKVENEDWSVWTPNMERRCGEDCKVTLGVWHRLKGMYDVMPVAIEIEHATAEEVRKTIARGFEMDMPYTLGLLSELQSEQEGQLNEFTATFPPVLVPTKPSAPEKVLQVINKNHPLKGKLEPNTAFCPVVVQEFNPGSEVQIAKRLITKYSWSPSAFTPTGQPQVTEEILRELPYPEAVAIADYLHTHKMVEQINAQPKSNGYGGGWLHHVDADNRVHPFLNPCKAVTGRLSCSAPNLQQVHTDHRMRRAWVPRQGYTLLGNDAEGLELRCLGHYLEPHDGGAYIKMLMEGDKSKGTDVHSVVRDLIGFYDRDQTKRAEYGWLYGAGNAKLGRIALQDAQAAGKEINYGQLLLSTSTPTGRKRKPSDAQVGQALRERMQEGLTGLKVLVESVRGLSKANGKLKGLDGRTLWSRSEHSSLNLLLQSAGAILVKKAWTLVPGILMEAGLVEGEDYACVIQVHDEFQYEVRPELVDTVGPAISKAIQQAGTELGFRCPLAGDYKSGPSWADTH